MILQVTSRTIKGLVHQVDQTLKSHSGRQHRGTIFRRQFRVAIPEGCLNRDVFSPDLKTQKGFTKTRSMTLASCDREPQLALDDSEPRVINYSPPFSRIRGLGRRRKADD